MYNPGFDKVIRELPLNIRSIIQEKIDFLELEISQLKENSKLKANIAQKNKKVNSTIILDEIFEIENQFKNILDQAPFPIFIKNLEGKHLFSNKADLKILNKTSEKVLGKTNIEIFEPVSAKLINKLEKKVLETGITKVSDEIINYGYGVRSFITTRYAYRDKNNNIIGLFGLGQEITELKNYEKKILEAQRMEILGLLTGGVAHDFNNILSGILGYSTLLQQELIENNSSLEVIDNIILACERARDLIKRILSFNMSTDMIEKNNFFIREAIEETLSLIKMKIKKDIKIEQIVESGQEKISGDMTQIIQVLINIFINAIEAMPKGGLLKIETSSFFLDKENKSEFQNLAHGKYIKINISDTGKGISKINQTKIFEPFYTTKKSGQSTGLGLTTCYSIIKGMNGEINVKSKFNKGTKFTILLPQGTKSKIVQQAYILGKSLKINLFISNKKILIIDSNVIVQNMLSKLLSKLGNSVIVASNSKEAQQIYTQDKDNIDLVIFDPILPDKNGIDMFKELKLINSDIKAFLSTNFLEKDQIENFMSLGVKDVLVKPYKLADLSNKLNLIFN